MPFVSAWRRMTVYAVVDEAGGRQWRYTLRPQVDAVYWRDRRARCIIPLQPPIPAMWAESACRMARKERRGTRG